MRGKLIVGSSLLAAIALYVVSSDSSLPPSSSDGSTGAGANGTPAAITIRERPNNSPVAVRPVSEVNDYGVAMRGQNGRAPIPFVDEDSSQAIVREEAIQDVGALYSRLLDDVDLTASEKGALIALLVEDRIASTWTPYSQGKEIDKADRNRRISAIIGNEKLQRFLAREANLRTYAEVERIDTVLAQNDLPLTEGQGDRLFELLVDLEKRAEQTMPSDLERNSIEFLEDHLAALDEYQRLVIEQAPSVLSSQQIVLLDQKYQDVSYQRAAALDRQKDQRVANPDQDLPISYPGWQ